MDIKKIISELPQEARNQVINIYCVDQNKDAEQLTLAEVVGEVRWTADLMRMSIEEGNEVAYAKKQLKACEKLIRGQGR
jgi:hypothetical protein